MWSGKVNKIDYCDGLILKIKASLIWTRLKIKLSA